MTKMGSGSHWGLVRENGEEVGGSEDEREREGREEGRERGGRWRESHGSLGRERVGRGKIGKGRKGVGRREGGGEGKENVSKLAH